MAKFSVETTPDEQAAVLKVKNLIDKGEIE